MAQLIVVYDASVLYPAPLRDLLMRLALADLYQAKWTEDIHQEWIRSLLKKRLDLTKVQLEKIKEKMDMHVRDSLVTGYKNLIKKIVLPDPDDRHVVAAAIRAHASIIVTYNLSDFPPNMISKYGIIAYHPDQFLRILINVASSVVIQIVYETRHSLKNPPKTVEEYLDILERQMLTQTVEYLRGYSKLI